MRTLQPSAMLSCWEAETCGIKFMALSGGIKIKKTGKREMKRKKRGAWP